MGMAPMTDGAARRLAGLEIMIGGPRCRSWPWSSAAIMIPVSLLVRRPPALESAASAPSMRRESRT
jgi:hypothetical protein